MMSWKPCMSWMIEPIAVPSAANTTAISAMKQKAQRARAARCAGRKPGDQADHEHERALDRPPRSRRRASGRS